MAACKLSKAFLILYNASEPPDEHHLSPSAGCAGYWTASALWTSLRTRRGLCCAPHSQSPALPPRFQYMSCCPWTLSGSWSGKTGRCASQAYAMHNHEASSLLHSSGAMSTVTECFIMSLSRPVRQMCIQAAFHTNEAVTGSIRDWPRMLFLLHEGWLIADCLSMCRCQSSSGRRRLRWACRR